MSFLKNTIGLGLLLILVCHLGLMGQDTFPREVQWGASTIKLKAKPERIFVSYVGALEVLEALVDVKSIVACPKMASDSQYSNCVEFANKVSFVFSSPDIEMIEKCNPDFVILANFNDPKLLDRLKTFQRPYVVLDKFDSYADICETIQFLGKVTGEDKKAENILINMKSELDFISKDALTPKPKMMTFGYNRYTAGAGTIFGEMLQLSGVENVAATFGIKGHKQLEPEILIKINPDYFVIYSQANNAREQFIEEMKKSPAFNLVPALQNNKVIVMPPALGTTTSQHFVSGVKLLHQKYVEQKNK